VGKYAEIVTGTLLHCKMNLTCI